MPEIMGTSAAEWIETGFAISGIAAWLSSVVKDKGWLRGVMFAVNVIGGNVGAAANDPAKNG